MLIGLMVLPVLLLMPAGEVIGHVAMIAVIIVMIVVTLGHWAIFLVMATLRFLLVKLVPVIRG